MVSLGFLTDFQKAIARHIGRFGNTIPLAIMTGLLLYSLFALTIPFTLYNNLYVWDAAGLYSSAWYTKEYLFPMPMGWNPYFLFGYSQNQFYPPLYPYASALLGQAMPLEWAFKLILAVTLILTPVSFYYFCRSFGFSRGKAAACAALMFAILFIFPKEYFGGNMHATFKVGLFANAVSLMLFFFYFGSMKQGIESGKIAKPTILLALIVLTHTVTGLAGSILAIAFAVSKANDKKGLAIIGKHILLAFLLVAFWAVPAIAKIGYSAAVPIGELRQTWFFAVGAIAFLAIGLKWRKEIVPAALFTIIVLALYYLSIEFVELPLHPYRFMMFLYLLIPFAFLSLLKEEKAWHNITYLAFASLAFFVVFAVQDINPEGPAGIETQKLPRGMEGRVMVIVPFKGEPSPHLLQQKIPMENGVYSVRGLFVESSKNSHYIFDIEKQLDPVALDWGTSWHAQDISYDYETLSRILPAQLSLFNINYIVTTPEIAKSFLFFEKIQPVANYSRIDKETGEAADYKYFLYKAGESGLVEVLDKKPIVYEGSDWYDSAAQWLLSDKINGGMLVAEKVPEFVSTRSEKLEMLETSPTMDKMRFRVDSNRPVPILIKMSEFPNWKAYQGNMQLKIYRAAPHLMLVYGFGEIELRYEQLPVDIVGYSLSAIGLVTIVFLAWREKQQPKN